MPPGCRDANQRPVLRSRRCFTLGGVDLIPTPGLGSAAEPTTGDVWPGGVAAEVAWIGRAPEGPGHDFYLKAYGVCVD